MRDCLICGRPNIEGRWCDICLKMMSTKENNFSWNHGLMDDDFRDVEIKDRLPTDMDNF